MDIFKIEGIELNESVSEVVEPQFAELSELQLAAIGGGCGETVFH